MDKLELENRQLKTLSTSYQDQVEEANAKIKQLQDSMNDTASDEMASLLRDLNEATSLRVSDGVDRLIFRENLMINHETHQIFLSAP